MLTFYFNWYCILNLSAINKGDVKDTEIETMMDSIVDSLFSVFVTLGKFLLPMIKRVILSLLAAYDLFF